MPAQERHGFSLIELLVAISIISIISIVGFSMFSQAQMRGRDAKRKQDLRSIALALELYYRKNNHYPCNSWLFSYPPPSGFWIVNDSTLANCGDSTHAFSSSYINTLPIDPTNNATDPYSGSGSNYSYGYWASSTTCNGKTGYGVTYLLIAQLENKNDPDRLAVKNQRWCASNDNLYSPSGANTIPSGTAFAIIGE